MLDYGGNLRESVSPKQSRRDSGCWDKAERSRDDQSDWGGGSDSHWAENPEQRAASSGWGQVQSAFILTTPHVLTWEPEGEAEGEFGITPTEQVIHQACRST